MILLLIIVLYFILLKFGLFVFLQIILLISTFLITNFIIGINPDNNEMRVIRVIVILVLIFLLIYNYNSESIFIGKSLLIPLSISKISYFEEKEIYYVDPKFETQLLNFWESELTDFINNLEDNANYVISIEYLPEFSELISEQPRLFLSKPILINKHSSPTLISQFIDEKLKFMIKYFNMNTNFLEISQNNSRILLIYQKVNF